MDDSTIVLVNELEIGVGILEFAEEDGSNTVPVQVTLLDFTRHFGGEPIRVAIPMGTPIGDLFFTGEAFMQIRDLWNQWFQENKGHDVNEG